MQTTTQPATLYTNINNILGFRLRRTPIIGDNTGDHLLGRAGGNDTIIGGTGADGTITGGAGADYLIGGAGADPLRLQRGFRGRRHDRRFRRVAQGDKILISHTGFGGGLGCERLADGGPIRQWDYHADRRSRRVPCGTPQRTRCRGDPDGTWHGRAGRQDRYADGRDDHLPLAASISLF